MDARQLLQNIEARGGVATVKRDGGAASINVAPRSLALELLPDLQRFKPALLELLAHGDRYVSEVPSVAVARGPDDLMAQRVAAQWNATFTPEEIEEYNRAVAMLDDGHDPEGDTP